MKIKKIFENIISPIGLVILINLFNLLDIVITQIGLKKGLVESNVIARLVFNHGLTQIYNLIKITNVVLISMMLFYQAYFILYMRNKQTEIKKIKTYEALMALNYLGLIAILVTLIVIVNNNLFLILF